MPVPSNPVGGEQFRVFHYPPELLNLLVDTIPLLCRSKKDTFLFFEGAGVPQRLLADLKAKFGRDRESISKYEISRTVLERLNASHTTHLREMREVVRRVVQYENFSSCWPNDILKAKGLVSEIQKVVNVKDSFTKMRESAEQVSTTAKVRAESIAEAARKREATREAIKQQFFKLFGEQDAHKRGKQLESCLNDLFKHENVLVREAFTIKGTCGEGIIEQIDGVIEIDSYLYLVEMKWWNSALGPGDVAQHLVRVFSRGGSARGIFLSYTEYTASAISSFKEALAGGAVVAAGTLEEIVFALNGTGDDYPVTTLLRHKIHKAILDKNPFSQPSKLQG